MAKKKKVSVGYQILNNLQKNTDLIGQTQKTTNGYGYSILSKLEKETKEMEARSQAISMLGAQSRSGSGLPSQKEQANGTKKITSSNFWKTPAQEQIRLAEELQPDIDQKLDFWKNLFGKETEAEISSYPDTVLDDAEKESSVSRVKELQKSYQEALDEAIEANPGVSLHNIPVTDEMKSIREQMDELERETREKRLASRLSERYADYDPTITEPDHTELERAKEEYEAAYAQYQIAEEYYYSVPDGNFQKAEDDFLAADARLTEAEARVKKAEQDIQAQEDMATYNKYKAMIASLSEKEFEALLASNDQDDTMSYGYLLKQGYSRYDINAMYETLLRGLNAEMSENVLGSVYDFAGQNFGTGAVGFAGARAGQFLGGFTGTAQVILDTARHYFQGSPYHGTDPNGPGYLPSRAAAAADQGASDAIEGEDGNFLRKAAAFVYRGAANAADNLVRMAIASAVGGGSLYGAKINSAFSFTQGFQGSYRESQEKAGSPIQGWLVGSVDGGMEVFTESRTFERWMNLKDPELIGKDAYAWLKSAAVGIGNEITEEEASYIANTIADAVVMADKSESAEFIKDAVAAGKTPAEAKWELVKKYAHEMAVTAADTAMSTLLMDAGTGVVANYQENRLYKKNYGEVAQELVQEGLESPDGTQSRNLAEQYQKKLDAGKQLSGSELRRLVAANEAQFAAEEANADSEKGTTTEISESGYTIKDGDGYTEIRFEEEPSQEMTDALEDNGFKYRDANNTWYGMLSPEETRGIIRENSTEQAGDAGNSSDAASGTMEEIKEPTLKVGHDLDSNQAEEEIADDSEMETTKEGTETGFTVGTDSKRGTTVISFEDVPPKEVQDALKENGFKFSSKNKVWYGQRSQEEARRIVLDAGGELYIKSEQPNKAASAPRGGNAETAPDSETSSAQSADKGQNVISKPFHASDTYGTTLLNLPDGSTVETEITGIASNEPGKLMLNVSGEDRPVLASDISYADSGEASLFYYVNEMELMPEAANMIVEQAKNAVSGMDGSARAEKMAQFSQSIYGMYNLGKIGVPQGRAVSSQFAGQLSESMAEAGYQLGRRIYLQNVQEKEASKQKRAASQRARAVTSGTKVNGVQYDGLNVRTGEDGSVEIDGVTLNEQQKAGIQAAEMLASMGLNVHVFQSKTDANGKQIGENGSYYMADGSIHIDLNAGNDGQGVMAYTISHELTHFMEDQQPEQFRIFTDALFEGLETDIEAEIANKAEKLKRQHPKVYQNASQDKLMNDARSEVIAEACETMLTDTDAAKRIAQKIQQQDASLWERIVQWFKDLSQKLRDAYEGFNPDSQIARDAKKTIQQVDGLVQMWADMAVDAGENYRGTILGDYGITNDDAMYSIRRTSNMSWGQQIKSALKHNGKIQHMDTLVVMNKTPAYLLTDDTVNLPMAIPLSVITKAQKGKNADHAISDKNLIALQYGMENAIAVIDNPERNSFAFITSLEEDGGRVVVFFDKNVQFDGDQVNKATSIHRRTNIVGLMNNLSDNSIIYVKNKNEFDTLVGMADSIPAAYKGKIKFVEDSISQDDGSVKRSDRKAETEESHKKELAETKNKLSKEAQEKREKLLRDYQKNRNISVENWRLTELSVLKTAAENVTSMDLTEREKNGITYFSRHLKKLEAIQGEIDSIKNQEGELSQKDLKKITALEKQADSVRKLIWEYSEYDVLKKVSEKTRKLLMEKYGSIKPGENPSRQADIPKRTNDQNRVSKTVRTAIEASATSDETAEKLLQKVIEGEFSYLPITDDASSKRAVASIERKGWDDSLIDWKVAMRKTDFPGKDLVTLGLHLYNNAVNSGKTKEALDILTDITNTVRNSAQVVQAVRILKKLSPENRLYAIQRQISALQDDLVKRYGDKAPQIDMNSALVKNYMDAQGEENIRAAEKALFRDIAAQLPNTFADKWNSWRYLSMLGNVRTHVRNVVGNVGFVPVRATKDLIAAGMEAAVDKLSKNGIDRTKSVLNPLNEADRALYTAGMNDYAAAEELLDKANLKSGDSISRIEQYKPAFGGDKAIWRALSKVAEANSNALAFEDMLFKKTTYASAFAGYMKANKVTSEMLQKGEVAEDFLDKARVYAFEEALKATYNDFNDFSNFVAKLGRLRNSRNPFAKAAGFLAEGVLPFKRTPANIVTRAVEYSPIGMVNGIKKSLFDVRSGKVTAAEAIDALASGLTGTVLLGLGGLLASMGLVSGGDDDDDKQEAFDKLRGKQSYALNAFGGSYTIDWLAPEIIPLFVGVELYNRAQEDGGIGFNDLLESFARVSNPILEMSCLQSLNDLLDSVSYSDNKLYSIFSQAAANHVLQALPTLFGQIERVGETEREQTYIDKNSQIPKDLQYTIAKAANKIPGVEFEQIPYIDAYGRRQETGNIGTRMFSNLASPGYLSSDRSAPWDDELERLYKLGFETVYPQRPTTKINQKELTAEEYVDHATFTGQERYRLLGLVLSSDYYKSKNDAEKAEIIADVYSYVAAEGKYRYDKDSTIPKWTKTAMEREKKGGSFIDVLKMREEDRSKNGNLTKEQCVEYIKNNFPESQWEEVWNTMKLKTWTNKDTPWE